MKKPKKYLCCPIDKVTPCADYTKKPIPADKDGMTYFVGVIACPRQSCPICVEYAKKRAEKIKRQEKIQAIKNTILSPIKKLLSVRTK